MRRTVDISGFGGSYEWGCQLMLDSGLEFLKAHPDFSFAGYRSFKNMIGILMPPEDGHAKEFEEALLSHPAMKEHGATGAMHQVVVQHLAFIHEHGVDKWLAEFPEKRQYDFDGTLASCPQTDLSRQMDKDKP